jgi:hypothetical protein
MTQYRRVGHGQDPYMSKADIRAELEREAEEYPAAMGLLIAALTAMEHAGTPIGVTCTQAPRTGGMSVGGHFPHGRNRLLTVAPIGNQERPYPRTPTERAARSGDRPLSLDEAASHIDPDDPDFVLLLEILRALAVVVEPQLAVEAIAPTYWEPEAIVRTPDGDRLTLGLDQR